MQRTRPVVVALLLAFVMFAGMHTGALAQNEADSPSANPIVNIAHFAPFAANPADTSVTISVNGADVFTEVVFGDTFLKLSVLPADVYTVEVRPTGTVTVAMSGVFTLEEDTEYTILAIGDGSANMPLQLEAIVKPNMTQAAGNAMVLLGHYAPFAATVPGTAVDICNDATGAPMSGLTGVPYGVNSGYLPLPAGLYDLSIAIAGTNCGSVAYDLPALQFNAGEFYDAFAIGKNNAAYPLTVVSLSGLDFPPAIVNVAHFAPFADDVAGTSVTIAVNGVDTFTDVVFGYTVTGVQLPAGVYTVEIRPTGANTVAMAGVFPLESNKEYSLVAIGDASPNMPLELKGIVKDTAPPATGNAKVLIGHYAPFAATIPATAVDICNDATNSIVFPGVPYGVNSGYQSLPAGIYDLSIALAGTNCAQKALDLPPLQFNAGEVYDAFAIGKNSAVFPLDVVSLSGLDFPAMATIGHFAPFAETVAGTAVDIRVNGQVAFTNVVYGQYVADVVVPSGDVLVEIVTPSVSAASGEVSNAVILSNTFPLAQTSKYVLFAIGGANGYPAAFAAREISQTAPAGQALATIGHLAPFASLPALTAVDICMDGEPITGLTNLQYPNIVANIALPAGVYELVIAQHNTNCTPVITLAPFRLKDGDIVNAFAIGYQLTSGATFPVEVISTTGLRTAYELFLSLIARGVAE
jgi:hypothetical protein